MKTVRIGLLVLITLCGSLVPKTPAWADEIFLTGFAAEIPLSASESLDAIRYLQARLEQPHDYGRFFVRDVRVLLPADGNVGVFAYLVSFQTNVPANRAYDVGNFYSIAGYYLVLLTRSGDEFTLLDEITLTPGELTVRLNIWDIPPPEITSDPDDFDFSDAVFDATDPALAAWRQSLVEFTVPRWDWLDLTGDGLLDCIFDIEGFEFQPTSYYLALVTTRDGFIEGFRSWGYDTDFSEIEDNGIMAIRADRYSLSAEGDFIPSWRDYYLWNGMRFILANLNFADGYSDLIPGLEELAAGRLSAETDENGRWQGQTRFVINATRYLEGLGTPSEYYFSLARIAEYRGDLEMAERWWGQLMEYLNGEYDSRSLVELDGLDPEVLEVIPAYEEWRDEMYAAAEAALEGG